MKLSEQFTQITNQYGLYSIQAISNIPSIKQFGILSYERSSRIEHVSIALLEVQARREEKTIPNGLKLHQYANLYFDPRNPMLSRVRNMNSDICILKIDRAILVHRFLNNYTIYVECFCESAVQKT